MGIPGVMTLARETDSIQIGAAGEALQGRGAALDGSLVRYLYDVLPRPQISGFKITPRILAAAIIRQIHKVTSFQHVAGQPSPPLYLFLESVVPRAKWDGEARYSAILSQAEYERGREGRNAYLAAAVRDDPGCSHVIVRWSPFENDEAQAAICEQLNLVAISYDTDVLFVAGCIRMVFPRKIKVNNIDQAPYTCWIDTQTLLDKVQLTLGQFRLGALLSRSGFDGHNGLFRFSMSRADCLGLLRLCQLTVELDFAAIFALIRETKTLDMVTSKNELGLETEEMFAKAWTYQWERLIMVERYQIFLPCGAFEVIRLLFTSYRIAVADGTAQELGLWDEQKATLIAGLKRYLPVVFDPSIRLGQDIRLALVSLPPAHPYLDTLASVIITRIVPWSTSQHHLYRSLTRADHISISQGVRSPRPPYGPVADACEPDEVVPTWGLPDLSVVDIRYAITLHATYKDAENWFNRAMTTTLGKLSQEEQTRLEPVLAQLTASFRADAEVMYHLPDELYLWRRETEDQRATRLEAEAGEREARRQQREEGDRATTGGVCVACKEVIALFQRRTGSGGADWCERCYGHAHYTVPICSDCDIQIKGSNTLSQTMCHICSEWRREHNNSRRPISSFSTHVRQELNLRARALSRGLKDAMTDSEWAATVRCSKGSPSTFVS